jgi:hypothetical protein
MKLELHVRDNPVSGTILRGLLKYFTAVMCSIVLLKPHVNMRIEGLVLQ